MYFKSNILQKKKHGGIHRVLFLSFLLFLLFLRKSRYRFRFTHTMHESANVRTMHCTDQSDSQRHVKVLTFNAGFFLYFFNSSFVVFSRIFRRIFQLRAIRFQNGLAGILREYPLHFFCQFRRRFIQRTRKFDDLFTVR